MKEHIFHHEGTILGTAGTALKKKKKERNHFSKRQGQVTVRLQLILSCQRQGATEEFWAGKPRGRDAWKEVGERHAGVPECRGEAGRLKPHAAPHSFSHSTDSS